MMMISMIAAIGTNYAIGKDNDLVWHLPDDMKYFKKTTNGHTVIMGRKNYESLPPKWRPLPNRMNLVISRNINYQAPGCKVFTSIDEGLQYAASLGESEVFIIGGGQIYQLGLPKANRLYITEIRASFEADAFFPKWDDTKWKETSRVHHPMDDKHKFEFDYVIYDRV